MKALLRSKSLTLLLLATFLTACGGGSDNSSTETPQPAVWNNSNWDTATWQ